MEARPGPEAISGASSNGVEWAKRSRSSKLAIRVGMQPRPTAKPSAGVLASARDWQLLVDLEQQLKCHNNVVTTTLRPEIIL